MGDIGQHLVKTLSTAGFLEDEAFERMQAERRREFAETPVREPAHAGSAYPEDAGELRETMGQYMDGAAAGAQADGNLVRASPRRTSARRAAGSATARRTACCDPNTPDRTFVILATSHYGEPENFGLTRKNYRTPLGEAQTDQRLVDWLAERGGPGVEMEDYCHSFEHTVELQVIFLQHMLGAGVKILPMLCGSVRAQPVPGRRSGRRRQSEGVLRGAGRTARTRRRQSVLGAGRGHGAHGRALSGPVSPRWRERAR